MKYLNFLKIFAAISVITSFLVLLIAGTGFGVNDFIMEHIMGHTSIVNAIGASGTIIAALGFMSISVAFILVTYEAINEEKSLTRKAIVGMLIFFASLSFGIYSFIVMLHGMSYIPDAYNYEIYGVDACVQSFYLAFSGKIPLLVSGIISLILFAKKISKEKYLDSFYSY